VTFKKRFGSRKTLYVSEAFFGKKKFAKWMTIHILFAQRAGSNILDGKKLPR